MGIVENQGLWPLFVKLSHDLADVNACKSMFDPYIVDEYCSVFNTYRSVRFAKHFDWDFTSLFQLSAVKSIDKYLGIYMSYFHPIEMYLRNVLKFRCSCRKLQLRFQSFYCKTINYYTIKALKLKICNSANPVYSSMACHCMPLRFWLAWTKSRKSYCTTPSVGISVGVGVGVVSKKFNVKVFYVMGKALSDEQSYPCDRSCLRCSCNEEA